MTCPPRHGEVGVEGALLDARRLGAWDGGLNDHRRPLLEVDADPQAERRVEPIEQTAVQGTEGYFRMSRRSAPQRWHGVTIAHQRCGHRGCRSVRSVD